MAELSSMGQAQPQIDPNAIYTLYANNLNTKINPNRMKVDLHAIFSSFGELHDIICMKSLARKGQAWVIYKDAKHAKDALASLQNFPVHDKPIRLQYAKSKSDVIAKADGTFVQRTKKRLKEDPAQREAKRLKAAEAAPAGQIWLNPTATMPTLRRPVGDVFPNKTLFVQKLPGDATEDLLRRLFGQYQGFANVRFIAVKHCAFVDFQSEPFATHALRQLATLELAPGQKLDIGYAR